MDGCLAKTPAGWQDELGKHVADSSFEEASKLILRLTQSGALEPKTQHPLKHLLPTVRKLGSEPSSSPSQNRKPAPVTNGQGLDEITTNHGSFLWTHADAAMFNRGECNHKFAFVAW